MDETAISNLEEDFKHGKVTEKCYQGLLTWRGSVGLQKATTKKLCHALRLVGCTEGLEMLWKDNTVNNRQ